MASFEMHTRPDDKHMRTDWMVVLNIESFLQGDCSARVSGIRKSLRHQQLLVLFEYVFSLVIMGANANWWWDCSDFAEPWSTKAWEHMTERSLNPKVSHSMLGDCGHHIEEFFMSMSEQIQCARVHSTRGRDGVAGQSQLMQTNSEIWGRETAWL